MKIPETELYKSEWRDYHPWKQHGRQRGMKDWRLDTKRRQAIKAEEAMVRFYESDTYYFPWNWGWEDVIDGLFGEFMAEKELEGILAGLEDFAEGRCKHFKNDEELEEYLMELPESMRTNLEASLKRNKEAFDCLKSL
jgi:asparagine synthetase B (glutamine-hydrolysing)